MNIVMQRDNERGRIAVDGRRTDDGGRCTLLAVCEIGGTWALYPHGWDAFGVRVDNAKEAGAGHPGGRCAVSDSWLAEWIALRQVHDGGVAKSAGSYLDHGRPVPSHLTEVLDRLTWTGLVTVADGDPVWSVRRLSLTDPGQVRYAVLCAERQQPRAPREAPAAEFVTPPPGDCRW